MSLCRCSYYTSLCGTGIGDASNSWSSDNGILRPSTSHFHRDASTRNAERTFSTLFQAENTLYATNMAEIQEFLEDDPTQPRRSPSAPPGLAAGFWAAGVLEPDAGAPQRPALVFCLAMSAMVTFWEGVPVFLGPPPRRDANASPPDADEAGFFTPTDGAEGVEPVDVDAP